MRWSVVGVAVGVFAAGLSAALTLHSLVDGAPRTTQTTTAPTTATTTTTGSTTETETVTETTTEDGTTETTPFGESYQEVTDKLKDELESANIAFNYPSTLDIGETAVIQLLLSLDKPISELQAELTGSGAQEGESVQVSRQMVAELKGDEGLVVTPTTGTLERFVTPGADVEWKWLVTGTKSGRRTLVLTLYALVTVEGDEIETAFRSYQQTIAIDVTWSQRLTGFVDDNWQWLWTAILVPLAALGWAAWQRRRTPDSGTPDR